MIFVLTMETLPRRGFILKPIETPYVPLQNGNGDFQNSHSFIRLACFYVKIKGDFDCFLHFNFETSFLKN